VGLFLIRSLSLTVQIINFFTSELFNNLSDFTVRNAKFIRADVWAICPHIEVLFYAVENFHHTGPLRVSVFSVLNFPIGVEKTHYRIMSFVVNINFTNRMVKLSRCFVGVLKLTQKFNFEVPSNSAMIDCARIQCLPIREIEAKLQVSDSTIDRVLQKFKSEILKQPPVPSNSANRLLTNSNFTRNFGPYARRVRYG